MSLSKATGLPRAPDSDKGGSAGAESFGVVRGHGGDKNTGRRKTRGEPRRPLDAVRSPVAGAIVSCETLLELLKREKIPREDPQGWLLGMMNATGHLEEALLCAQQVAQHHQEPPPCSRPRLRADD